MRDRDRDRNEMTAINLNASAHNSEVGHLSPLGLPEPAPQQDADICNPQTVIFVSLVTARGAAKRKSWLPNTPTVDGEHLEGNEGDQHHRSTTVGIEEAEVQAYLALYPGLERMDVLRVIVNAGPWRAEVERQLERLCRSRRTALAGSIGRLGDQ